MKLETIISRIANTEKKIVTVEKRIAKFESRKQNDSEWDIWDERDLSSSKKELSKLQDTLRELKSAEVEAKKNQVELPEIIVEFRDKLGNEWAKQDIQHREEFIKEFTGTAHAFTVLSQKYGTHFSYLYNLMQTPDSTILRNAMRDATTLCENLVQRTKKIVGTITDYKNLHLEEGSHGLGVLNGYVAGTDANAYVESVYCGGYNIQRLHVRVLVKKM